MTPLKQFRLSPRWLVLLVGLAVFAVTTASLMPHQDSIGEDIDCLVCKAGHQPLTELSPELVAEPPLVAASRAPGYQASPTLNPVVQSGSPRAPPL